MPTITITYYESDDVQRPPTSVYTLKAEDTARLLLCADEYLRDPPRQAGVLLAEKLGSWKPKAADKLEVPTKVEKKATTEVPKGRSPVKDTNGAPVTSSGTVPLTGGVS